MTRPYTKAALLEALKEGFSSMDWMQHAASPGSLRVRIHRLRSVEGYPITSRQIDHVKGSAVGRPPVFYKLEEAS